MVYRVFHLIKGLGRGGAETLLSEGIRYADREKFEYGYGYFLAWKDALVPSLRKAGATVVCFDAGNALRILLSSGRVARFLKEWKADLVHCHLPMAGIVGRVAARKAGLPIIYTEHNVMERYHPLTRLASLQTWNLQNEVIAVSAEVGSSIQRYAGDGVPVHIVPNGISIDSFVPDAEQRASVRKNYGIPVDAPVIGTVAVFRKQKNLSGWVKAARRVLSEFPDTHFLLVGDGPLRSKIELECRALGLADAAHFTGLQPDAASCYAAMDIYMSSSDYEGLPLSLLEAMAMRLPCVVTDVGGIPEVVQDGSTGYLVQPKSPESLAEKVAALLMNSQTREQFGINGRRVVEERFSLRRMMGELEEIYSKVLSAPDGGGSWAGSLRI